MAFNWQMENAKGIFEGTRPIREGTTAIGFGVLAYVMPCTIQYINCHSESTVSYFRQQTNGEASDLHVQPNTQEVPGSIACAGMVLRNIILALH
jgi:hypothetical protein